MHLCLKMIIPILFLSTNFFFLNLNAETQEESEQAQASEVDQLEFLVTNKSDICRVAKSGISYRYFINSTSISDVDYHLERKLLFWIDATKREIHSQPLNGNLSTPHITFTQNVSWEPVALAIDFIGNKVYVADALGQKIDVFELDGRYHAIVSGTNFVRLVDVKLDPYERWMFILDGLRIVRANMDGSSPVTVISQGVRILHGFFIDAIVKKIYWSRNTDFQIMSSNYSGENVSAVENNSFSNHSWSKFASFNESIFWASHFVKFRSTCPDERKEIRRKTIYESNPVPTIKILHPLIQNATSNPCEINNGECEHMCIISIKNYSDNKLIYRCACNVGWILASNMKNCIVIKDFLTYAQGSVMKNHLVEKCDNSFCEPYLPIAENRRRIRDFDYHFTDNYLYYIYFNTLTQPDSIYRIHTNKSVPEMFSMGEDEYSSLAIDQTTTNLYFANFATGTINVVNTRNVSQKLVLLENLEKPRDLVLHVNKGYLFFFQTNESTKVTVLSRVNVDGSNFIVFINKPLEQKCGFAIDYNDNQIYWYNWKNKYIEYSNLDMNEVKNIQTAMTKHLYAISIYEDWIYAASMWSTGVWRFDKRTGERAELILADFANRITKIKVFSADTQKINRDHPCIINNGGCPEFCFGLPLNTNDSWVRVCANSNITMYNRENKHLSLSGP